MRGSSATEQLLTQHPEWKVPVLVIWEPILPTDWRPPNGSTLGRISDARAQQFWDPKHVISGALQKMAGQMSSEPKLDPGEKFYWDMALVFAPHSKWEDSPAPLFWRGPVYRSISGLAAALGEAVHPAARNEAKNKER